MLLKKLFKQSSIQFWKYDFELIRLGLAAIKSGVATHLNQNIVSVPIVELLTLAVCCAWQFQACLQRGDVCQGFISIQESENGDWIAEHWVIATQPEMWACSVWSLLSSMRHPMERKKGGKENASGLYHCQENSTRLLICLKKKSSSMKCSGVGAAAKAVALTHSNMAQLTWFSSQPH